MLFQTWTFALFFCVFYPVYLAFKDTRLRLPCLVLASYVFYGCWNPVYLVLLLWLTTVDYLAVVGMARSRHKRPWPWLLVSIVNGLGLLGFFKYRWFVVDNLNAVLGWLGSAYVLPPPDLTFATHAVNLLLLRLGSPYTVPPLDMLPVGISFYVFRSLSYTIDCYRGNVEREPGFLRYAAFVSLFPQLLMGPIDRAGDLLPQLGRAPRITRRDMADGLSLFVVGLFKKKALADYLALYVDKVYDSPGDFQAPALILATFAFAWQIYFDFSGYTDMARGIGRMIGLRLMLNFNNPYLATGLGDFWRRWHISLSTWFRDYLYIPLGGNRDGRFLAWFARSVVRLTCIRPVLKLLNWCLTILLGDLWNRPRIRVSQWFRVHFYVRLWASRKIVLFTYANICLTMVICGLWHGATWTFVIWGALHGLGYTLTRSLERTPFYKQRVPRLAKQLFTFSFVTFAWIFFKADSFGEAWLIVTRIFASGWSGPLDPLCPLLMLAMVLSVWLYQFAYESRVRGVLALAPVRVGLVVMMLLYLAVFGGSGDQGFIYLQF